MHKKDSNASASLPAVCPASKSTAMHTPTYSAPAPIAPSPPAEDSSFFSRLNPLNYMPVNLSQSRAQGQTLDLPVEREPSTILKGDGSGSFWEYPSPQQMYNAMLRKGYTDTPVDAVESMVAVHNFLNEGAWNEILEWERRFALGYGPAWRTCIRGEANAAKEFTGKDGMPIWDESKLGARPSLVRFMGRPGEMTPKARFHQALAHLMPSKVAQTAPFDRHDWYVRREPVPSPHGDEATP